MMRTSMDRTRGFGSMNTEEHWNDARKIGAAGVVLLKNEGNVLPMKANPSKIVVLGENAIKPMVVGGSS